MATIGGNVDREVTTPFHLKMFYRNGSFHSPSEFSPNGELPPHVQVYTWTNASLRELSHLLTSALPSLLPSPAIGTRIAFRLIFPDTRTASQVARFQTKELGSIVIGEGIKGEEDEDTPMAGVLGGEPDKTLHDARFVIGDYVSCAILPVSASGAVASPPSAIGGGGRGGFGGGYGGRGDFGGRGGRGGFGGGWGENGGFSRGRGAPVPSGSWNRGERVPDGPRRGGFDPRSGGGRPQGRW